MIQQILVVIWIQIRAALAEGFTLAAVMLWFKLIFVVVVVVKSTIYKHSLLRLTPQAWQNRNLFLRVAA